MPSFSDLPASKQLGCRRRHFLCVYCHPILGPVSSHRRLYDFDILILLGNIRRNRGIARNNRVPMTFCWRCGATPSVFSKLQSPGARYRTTCSLLVLCRPAFLDNACPWRAYRKTVQHKICISLWRGCGAFVSSSLLRPYRLSRSGHRATNPRYPRLLSSQYSPAPGPRKSWGRTHPGRRRSLGG